MVRTIRIKLMTDEISRFEFLFIRSLVGSWVGFIFLAQASGIMSAALDSKAVFRARAVQLGLDDTALGNMEKLGWTTLGSFGFACSYVPGQADDAIFKADIVVPVLTDAAHPMSAILRRLYFESYSMAASEMRGRLERTSSDPPRVIPQPEREQRFQALVRSLPGMSFKGIMEPAHAIADKMTQMLEQGQLR